jgi:hypothetical protein
MPYSVQDLNREITAHPKERLGFQQGLITQISPQETQEAIELLLQALEQGSHRCSQPLHWLLKGDYLSFLATRRKRYTQAAEAYFLVSYELFIKCPSLELINDMKQSLLQADTHWEFQATSFWRLVTEIISDKQEILDYCKKIVLTSQTRSLVRLALTRILECAAPNTQCAAPDKPKVELSPLALSLIDNLTSPERQQRSRAISEFNKLMQQI